MQEKTLLNQANSTSNIHSSEFGSVSYDIFGSPYQKTGSFLANDSLDFGYLGKPYNADTGLYDYGFRDYAPEVARFTSVDPIRDGRNWYSYVVNDPVNFMDLWGLCGSDGERKEESIEYLNWLKTIKDFNPKKIHVLVSKSNEGLMSYDSINNPEEFKALVSWVLDDIIKDVNEDDLVDPVQTALRVINDAFHMLPKIENPIVMFSYGKDSVTLMKLLEISKWIYKIKPLFLESPLDMDEIDDELKKNIKKYFNIEVYPFKGVPDGWNFENHSIPEIMKAKAEAIKKVIKDNDSQLTFVGSRHFEGDGTRAKDKFFSPRDKDGNANFYETSYERHGSEYTSVSGVNYSNCRVSPLLDFTEADIWRFINYYKIPVCKGYFSKNGKRYRSLGDKDTTVPIESQASTIEDIITEIEKSTDTERICRVTQDNSEKYGMEKIRTIGFF